MVYGSKFYVSLHSQWDFYFIQVATLKGYENANTKALELWSQTYPNDLFVALTDTFSTRVFFQACLLLVGSGGLGELE